MKLKSLLSIVGLFSGLLGLNAVAQEPTPVAEPPVTPPPAQAEKHRYNWERIEANLGEVAENAMKNHPELSTISLDIPEEENQNSDEFNSYIGVSFKNSLWTERLTELRLHANFKLTTENLLQTTLKLEGKSQVIKAIQLAAQMALLDRSTTDIEGAKELLEQVAKAQTIEDIFTPAHGLLELLKQKEPNDEVAQKAKLRINRSKTKITLTYNGDYPLYREGGINLSKLEVSVARGKLQAEVVITTPNGARDSENSFGGLRSSLLGSFEAGEGDLMKSATQGLDQLFGWIAEGLVKKSK